MLLDLIVQVHDMQDVQELALVLMETFYLHIEDGSRINVDPIVLLDIFRQPHFILVLDLHKLTSRVFIIYIGL